MSLHFGYQPSEIFSGDCPQDCPVDLSVLNDLFDGDHKASINVLEIFVNQLKDDVVILENHISDGTNRDWSELAHKMKGSAAYIGAETLRALCATAQDMINAGISERRDIFTKIETEQQRLKTYLKQNMKQ